MPVNSLKSLLTPRTVAVIGASNRMGSRGYRIWQTVSSSSGLRQIYPVNPKYAFVGNHPCFRKTTEIPGPVDFAVVAVERHRMIEVIKSLKDKKPGFALLAPQEEGLLFGKAQTAELIDVAHACGIRLIGPNSVGLMNPSKGINLSYRQTLPPNGSIALLVHSGMVADSLISTLAQTRIGFSCVVDVGLELDLTFPELIDHYANDSGTRVIGIQIEALRNPRHFFSAIRAATLRKPVVILRAGSGSSYAADRIAATRYDTDAGAPEAFEALCRAAGALCTDTLAAFSAALSAFACCRMPEGKNLAVIANSSGLAGLIADAADRAGLSLEGLSNSTIQRLHRERPNARLPVNPIILDPVSTLKDFRIALDAALQDAGIQNVLVALAFGPLSPRTTMLAPLIKEAQKSHKPVVFVLLNTPEDDENTARQDTTSRVLVTRSIEDGISALSAMVRLKDIQTAFEKPSSDAYAHLTKANLAHVREILRSALNAGRHRISGAEALTLLEAAGLSTVPHFLVRNIDEGIEAAKRIGWPVAVKIQGASLSQRTDLGLIELNIESESALRAAWARLTLALEVTSPLSQPEGFLIEKMIPHRTERELSLAIQHDAVLGPFISVGAAGIGTTLFRDESAEVPPVTLAQAECAVQSLRIAKTFESFRGAPAVDLVHVAKTLCRLSDLAAAIPAILYLKIEPAVPAADALMVLDAEIRLSDAPIEADRKFSHLTLRAPSFEDDSMVRTKQGDMRLRSIIPEDFNRIKTFVESLSEQSFYLRFHSRGHLSEKRIQSFSVMDHSTEAAFALALLDPKTGDETFAGIARWHEMPQERDTKTVEFGIVISDRFQRLGLGTILMDKIETDAAAEGYAKIVGYVLSGNDGMEGMMIHRGYRIEKGPDNMGASVNRWAKTLRAANE